MNLSTLAAADAHESRIRLRRLALRADGLFLVGVGTAQMVFELLGHFAGTGPLAAAFSGAGAHFTIGFLEAHGLALLFGVLLFDAGTAARDAHWHVTAAAIHTLLGGANLLFWPSFVALGLVPMGVVATAFHLGFVLLQLACTYLARFQSQ
jgi:hypothetical protein